jgi:ribosome-binding factor A
MSPDLRHAVCFVEPLGGVGRSEASAASNISPEVVGP